MSLQQGASAKRKVPSRREYSPEAIEFGRRLQRELIRKQWNQSDLARAAAKIHPTIARYNVSHWVRGRHIPEPVNQDAIERALGVPSGMLTKAEVEERPPLRVVFLPGGERVSVEMFRTMGRETWDKIAALLAKEDK